MICKMFLPMLVMITLSLVNKYSALFSGSSIEELCDYVDEAYALLRIKYHKTGYFSYTMTLRAKISDSGQDFDDQIFRIFDTFEE